MTIEDPINQVGGAAFNKSHHLGQTEKPPVTVAKRREQ
jgi:hypothetical protein